MNGKRYVYPGQLVCLRLYLAAGWQAARAERICKPTNRRRAIVYDPRHRENTFGSKTSQINHSTPARIKALTKTTHYSTDNPLAQN